MPNWERAPLSSVTKNEAAPGEVKGDKPAVFWGEGAGFFFLFFGTILYIQTYVNNEAF